MLRRLVSWSYDRRRRVVALWLVGLVAATLLAGAAGGDNEVDFTVPGSDSAQAAELLEERFPRFAGGSVDVVYTADGGVASPEVAARIDDLTRDIAGVDHVVAAEAGPVSPDGRTGVMRVRFDEPAEKLPLATVEHVMRLSGEAEAGGLRVELGGYPIEKAERQEAGSESVGLVAAAAHPADRVRVGPRRRAAARRRRRRPGRGAGGRVAPGQRARGPRLRRADRDDDRDRRGHRLRAVHRHPLPLGAGRRPVAA